MAFNQLSQEVTHIIPTTANWSELFLWSQLIAKKNKGVQGISCDHFYICHNLKIFNKGTKICGSLITKVGDILLFLRQFTYMKTY